MKHLLLPFIFALVFASLCSLPAQTGNNNPSGASGIFNGQVNTGCSYDPYTGNATRSITDIAVAGGVGEYPLALVRSANSRTPSTTEVFGRAGGWNHNYNWTMDDSPRGAQNFRPARYTVNFPDGRVETFRAVTWDSTAYRVRPGADAPAQSSSSGVRERLAPINPQQSLFDAYLILPDGGKVKFEATQHSSNGQFYYKYKAKSIIDPYGLETTFTYEVVGPNNLRRLTKVTEPAGRYLQFSYATLNGPRISQVQEFINGIGRRAVQYYYSYTMLDHVSYYSNPNWTANYRYTGSNIGQNLPPLLWTCDDPMYPGPMKRIAYEYKPATPNNPDGTTPVYGQILRERYWDGATIGQSVSELTVGESPNVTWKRKETRGDGAIRTFVYSGGGHLTWVSDFAGHQSTLGYDDKKYVNQVINFNRVTTDYTCDPITGNVTQIRFPRTPDDTPGQGNTRPTVNYTYTNNYYLQTSQDEGNHTSTLTRDGNNRVTRIDFPDGGYETFGYDSAHFYQLGSHRMVTGGTETFTYDGRGLKQTYRNPDNASANPTARYQYDAYDRVSDVTDVLGTSLGDANHTTSFSYNLRGQVAVTTLPNGNGSRHTIKNYYNDDGTLRSRENELYQSTQYTYDDYRRLRSVTPPDRGDGSGTHTTYLSYNVNGITEENRRTDSNVCWVLLPSGKWTNMIYDDNRRKTSVTVAWNTADAATTRYEYDNTGNLTGVNNPLDRNNVSTEYDERNRPSSVTVGGQETTFEYDTAGRAKTINRPDGQVITNVNFDAMNRVKLKTVSRSNNSNMVTQYVYYTPADGANAPVGLLKTFEDPKIYGSGEVYKYDWDAMGRKKKVTYPRPQTGAPQTYEQWTYDTAGRLYQFRNRDAKTQTFTFDALNRMSGFIWNDQGLTPNVSFGYDVASRLTSVNNVNANITRAYYNDNLLRSETEQILLTGGRSKTVTYTYDAGGNRASTQYPGNYTFGYSYTNRNQLQAVNGWATYVYDRRGNLTTRTLNANSTSSDYVYDTHDRVTRVRNVLSGTTRTTDYGYDDPSNNRLWAKRLSLPTSPESNKGEVFSYDLADQATGVQLNVANPDQVQQPIASNTIYDSNGNRTWFNPSGWNESYVINNLNQYASRTKYIGGTNTTTATYDPKGNLTLGLDTPNISNYEYDAQNRLLSANKGNTTMYFEYDGLNRQVSRRTGANGTRTFNVWDGWNLIEEYQSANQGATTAMYLYGASGLIAGTNNGQVNYYYQDGSGSTSHVANTSGQLLEWYRYDLQGTPVFYNPNDTTRSASGFGVRHLFTGQQWYSEIGLYDLRNRFYSPDLGRFLLPDPIGFRGDRTNLYRYCGNNPVTRWDPVGLQGPYINDGSGATAEPVVVSEVPLPELWDIPEFLQRPDLSPLERFGSSNPGSGGGGGAGGGGSGSRGSGQHTSPSGTNSTNPQQPPQQNPPQVSAAALAAPPATLAPTAGVFSSWQTMLITAFNDPIGDHDNRLGPGDIATADLRYHPSDFNSDNDLINVYRGAPMRAYPRRTLITIYRHDGSVYTGTITDTGAGFAAHRPRMGLPDGVPGTLWFDIWTTTGREDPEWDLVSIQAP